MTTTTVDAAQARRVKKYELLDASIARWQRKMEKADRVMARSIKMLAKLERQRRRMQKAMAAAPTDRPRGHVRLDPKHMVEDFPAAVKEAREDKKTPVADVVTDIPVSEFPIADSLDIPTYLKRDAKAAAEIKQEIADKKRTKALVRVEKLKAKKSGETKRMPLQGKAALAAIRG